MRTFAYTSNINAGGTHAEGFRSALTTHDRTVIRRRLERRAGSGDLLLYAQPVAAGLAREGTLMPEFDDGQSEPALPSAGGQRVRFATGEAAAALADELARLDARAVMLIATRAELARNPILTGRLAARVGWDEVVMHVPVEVADRARAVAGEHAVDALVSLGGGSATGLAKAIALTSGLPIVAVPTTYSGSEATNVWGLTDAGVKRTGLADQVRPRAIVYDAELSRSLPVGLSVASGLNAVAHCVDSMWAPRSNPANRAQAAEGIAALRVGLPAIVAEPLGLPGREQALVGAYQSAAAFASAGSGLHHKICHVLGGAYNLPHAQTHAVVLPYVLAFNAPAAPAAEELLAQAFGAADALTGLQQLRTTLAAPRSLRELGLAEADLGAAAQAILPAVPPDNPRPVTAADLEAMLHAAWAGDEPR